MLGAGKGCHATTRPITVREWNVTGTTCSSVSSDPWREGNVWRGDTKQRRSAARRNPSTAVRCRLLARVLVAIALAVPCVGAAQDEGPGVIDQVRSSLDGLLLRDDLTAQQVAVIEEMQAWLDALREQDLNPLHTRLLDAIARGLPHSAGELSLREIMDTVAALVDLVVDDELDEEQAAELEAKLVVDPDDIFSRTKLVRHYASTATGWIGSRSRQARGVVGRERALCLRASPHGRQSDSWSIGGRSLQRRL